jgi:hypothetical protein
LESFLINIKKDSKRKLDAAEKIQKWFKTRKLAKETMLSNTEENSSINLNAPIIQASNNSPIKMSEINYKENDKIFQEVIIDQNFNTNAESIEIQRSEINDAIQKDMEEQELLKSFEHIEQEINLSMREEDETNVIVVDKKEENLFGMTAKQDQDTESDTTGKEVEEEMEKS